MLEREEGGEGGGVKKGRIVKERIKEGRKEGRISRKDEYQGRKDIKEGRSHIIRE
jgi:hypothetical protein